MTGPPWPYDIAVHESGHAVVALELGLPLVGVWVKQDGGRCALEGPHWPATPRQAAQRLLFDVAGMLACHLAFPGRKKLSELLVLVIDGTAGCQGHPGDLQGALWKSLALASNGDAGAVIDQAEQEAQAILERRWDQLERLARALAQSPTGELSLAQVLAAIKGAD